MSGQVVQTGRQLSQIYSRVCSSPAVIFPLNYTNGQRCQPIRSENSFDLIAPSTGETLCAVPESSKDDLDIAVSNSRQAFRSWSRLSGFQRGQVLENAARLVRERCEDIAEVETLDSGKPIYESRMDVEVCADTIQYYAGLAAGITGEHLQLPNGNYAYTRREPIGVVGAIGAWNYPFQMAAWKSAPALACGNAMVFKPSPLTPLTAVMLAEIYTEVGVPPGGFNVIQGSGGVGEALCRHEGVDKVTFTGSVGSGVKVMEAAAQGIKHVTLELGGKSALIIFDDCDMENAVKGAMMANFFSQGQVCSNAARVFVQESIADEFVERLVARTARMIVGNPFDEKTRVGATICKDQVDKVMAYIQSAKDEGAKIVHGGEIMSLEEPSLNHGHYIQPCVITGCHDNMRVVKEEIFGPVITILPFKTEEEALERANNSPYGLAGGVFTKDLCRAHRITSNLEAGSLFVNTYNALYPGIPFGGYKLSGVGRENGASTIDYYTQVKSVYVETNDIDCPF